MTTAPIPHAEYAVPDRRLRRNTEAGVVLGITSMIFAIWPLIGLVLAIIGLVLSLQAAKRIDPASGYRGLAAVGLATSIIGLVLGALSTIGWIVAMIAAGYFYWDWGLFNYFKFGR